MSSKVETIGGASIAALILLISNLVTLFTENSELTFDMIKQSTWIIILGGAAVAFLKDYQALSTRRMIGKVTGTGTGAPPAQSPVLVGALALLLTAAAMSGCAGTSTAYKSATGLSETAYVVGEHYFALVRSVNDMDDAGQLTRNELLSVQEIAMQTRPTVVALIDAADAYDQVQTAATEDDLSNALAEAAIAISRFVDVIKSFGGSAQLESCTRAAEWTDSPAANNYCALVAAR